MSRSLFGTIQYISKGKYRVWWTSGGKRRSKRIDGTYDDAELFLAIQRIGSEGCGKETTYDEFWTAKIVPSFTKHELAVKTVENHTRVWTKELSPRIGKSKVSETTCAMVEDTLGEVSSAWVQRSAYQLWKKICNVAIRSGILQANPVDRYIRLADTIPAERQLLDAGSVLQWMKEIRGIKYEAILLAESGGGLRHEEACALLCEDIAAHERRGKVYALVNVEKALVSTRTGRVLKKLKNRFSDRESVIGEPFASRLLEVSSGSGPLCPNGTNHEEGAEWDAGNYSSPTSITNNYRTWCARNGVEYVNPGSLRKSWSIMHGEAGSPDSLVSLAMGHSDGTTRGRNYQKGTRRGMMMIADMLEELIDDES